MGWRVVKWALLLAWTPVLLETGCTYLIPRFEERVPATILVIPYLEFVTMPLTVAVILITLYKAIRAGLRHRRSNHSV